MNFEYLIVGAGLTGAVIARKLADAGKRVLVTERRSHLGGNVYDYVQESGIRIHHYGPHYFRTNDDDIWAFVNRFAKFHKFEAELRTLVDGRYEHWPVMASYIKRIYGDKWHLESDKLPANFEQASLEMMPGIIYEKFVKGYTEKQWGVPAANLSQDLAKRFEVRDDHDTRLMKKKYQGIPRSGYTAMVENMLKNIPVLLNHDYLSNQFDISPNYQTIFTGPIDEYFGFDMGRLEYRGQQRQHEYLPNVRFALPCAQVNNPDPGAGSHIRTIEWKHLMPKDYAARITGTILTREIPYSPQKADEYEYPFPDEANRKLYCAYRDRARAIDRLIICGRLGEYRYYDMDQAIERAMVIASDILSDNERFNLMVREEAKNANNIFHYNSGVQRREVRI